MGLIGDEPDEPLIPTTTEIEEPDPLHHGPTLETDPDFAKNWDLKRCMVEPAKGILKGIPTNWEVRPTKGPGGVWFYDPNNKGNAVRVMPGDPASPYTNSQEPYVRWQRNGQPLDVNGNVLPSKYSPEAHIPLQDFRFNPDVYK